MKRHYFIILILGILVGFAVREMWPSKPAAAKIITIQSRNLEFKVETRADTIEEVLSEQNISSSPIHRPINGQATHGMTVQIRKSVKVIITDAGNEKQIETRAATVNDLLWEQKIALAETDRLAFLLPDKSGNYSRGNVNVVAPFIRLGGFMGPDYYLADGMIINIDRIVDLEVTEVNEMPYEIKLEYSPESFYGREEIITAGLVGQKEQLFFITYKNGVEVKRKLLRERVLKKPIREIRKFGTKIEIEEEREGRASWYATKLCMPAFAKATAGKCAAHPFYDLGRYVRVTNLNSGQSIIVKINDRGPELEVHPDRVIDLDSLAYKELAPLGSGTIPVKVELLRY